MPSQMADPNGLSVLLGLSKQAGSSGNIPQLSTEDQFYDEMVPEEELYGAQDAIGAQGRASGGAYAIPSRQELRQSARAGVRRELAPTMIRERGADRRAEIQAGGQRDALLRFLIGEQNKAERAGESNQAALERAQLAQSGQSERAAASQASKERSANLRENAVRQRQTAGDLLKRAGILDKQAQGAWDLMGFGSKRKLQAQAAALRQQAEQATASIPLPGDDEEMDVSPEEWAAFQSWRQGAR